jgi:DNA-binding NtrC family response regulator
MKATVLIVDDDATLREALADRVRFWGHEVTAAASGRDALDLAARRSFDLILLDLNMPGMTGLELLSELKRAGSEAEKVVLTAHGSLEKVVEAMKRGADDFLTKPADFEILRRIVERSLEKRRLVRVNQAWTERTSEEEGMVFGASPAMREVFALADRVAKTDTTLLITGESGTGKQVLAEHVHRQSHRAGGPFVYVNCVAISDELIESTLFGHERGAFTGATNRKAGRLETAAGGTAFLDEIGDISPRLQAKLLHFLESGEFERVGGNQTVKVDGRIIAATNKDLAASVKAGQFREDLYFRLNVISIALPPLRERREDIPLLAETFLRQFGRDLKREGLRFSPEVMDRLAKNPWPGNVRQLRNAIERMAVLAPGEVLSADLLPPEPETGSDGEAGLFDLPYREALDEFRRRLTQRALARAGGNQRLAAEALGIGRPYLNRLLKELELPEP